MFKTAAVNPKGDGLKEANRILDQIYRENPAHWPNGLSVGHFDGGLYLVRKEANEEPVGFVGWQVRQEPFKQGHFGPTTLRKIGYYSVGILPAYRRNRYAKRALEQLFDKKAREVDQVRALVESSNKPSQGLAQSLGVPAIVS